MKVNAAAVTGLLKCASQYTGAELVNIKAANGKLLVSATNEGRSWAKIADIESNDKFQIAVRPGDGLTKLLKGQVNLQVNGSTLIVQTSTYKGEFQTEPYTATEFTDSPTQNVSLQTALAFETLLSYPLTSFMHPILCEFVGGKTLRVAVWDMLHFCIWEFNAACAIKGKFTLDDISTLFGALGNAEDFSLSTANHYLYARNSMVKFAMPSMLQETDNGLADIAKLSDSFKTPYCKVVASDLYLAIYNATSVCGAGETISLAFNKSSITISAESGKGRFQEVVKVDGTKSGKGNIDPMLLCDLLAHVKDKPIVLGLTEKFLWFKLELETANAQFACLLSQDSA